MSSCSCNIQNVGVLIVFGLKKKKKTEVAKPTNVYPYLFQTSGFQKIDAIRAELESQPNWDYAQSGSHAIQTQDAAAQKFGYNSPYTKEQFALRKILYVKRAGPKISVYAWGLYAESNKKTQHYA